MSNETLTKDEIVGRWMDFNINYRIRVRLTPHGREILRRNHRTLFGSRADEFRMIEVKENAEGWSEWQLWRLAHEFGSDMYMGGVQPFETTIQIDTEQRL